ncbi:MAG: class I SAM-dependent methyltransferase [Thermoguttaceae bacterium]|jgi:SAM-dependent methyltransferase
MRFFFKMGLHEHPGSVLEVGCGNGNNLMLFGEYDWNVVGIDIDPNSLSNAEANFSMACLPKSSFRFIQHDLTLGLPGSLQGPFDAILFPSSLYYIPRNSAIQVLQDSQRLAKPCTSFYLRMRGLRDHRYHRGEEIETNTFRLAIRETGEYGLLNTFYREHELLDMVRSHLGADPEDVKILHVDYDNIQNDVLVSNSDIVLWGRLRPQQANNDSFEDHSL